MDMRYPVVIATPELAKNYNVTSMPVTLLIDRQGRIALTHVGVVESGSFQRQHPDDFTNSTLGRRLKR